tara:strand:- start:181 stop:294 length:114 start_codon:yes stop_codon:yes gene_type:complete
MMSLLRILFRGITLKTTFIMPAETSFITEGKYGKREK